MYEQLRLEISQESAGHILFESVPRYNNMPLD